MNGVFSYLGLPVLEPLMLYSLTQPTCLSCDRQHLNVLSAKLSKKINTLLSERAGGEGLCTELCRNIPLFVLTGLPALVA